MALIQWQSRCFGAFFCLAVAVGTACTAADPVGSAEPGVGSVSEALSDSCSTPCSEGQMCCNGVCVARVIGPNTGGRSLAVIGPFGCLQYRTYANRPTSTPSSDPGFVNTLPDFSYAGYLGGGKAIPNGSIKVTVTTTDGSDDRKTIQDAIDFVGNNCPNSHGGFDCQPSIQGVRGVVLVKRGTYDIDGQLVLNKSGVILRGEGQGSSGTILRSLKRPAGQNVPTPTAPDGSNPAPDGSILIKVGGADPIIIGGAVNITAADGTGSPFVVPVGARKIAVVTANLFSPGQRVLVRRTPNSAWISELKLGQGEVDPPWTPEKFVRDHERTVVAVGPTSGGVQTITVDIPLVDSIESRYGGGQVVRVALDDNVAVQNVGIERIRLDSLDFVSSDDEEHTASGIVFDQVRNSWIRQVTLLHFGYKPITIDHGRFITVEDTAVLDPISQLEGSRRYPFNLFEGTGNLFQRNYARYGRHNFVTNKLANGPNVFLDCAATRQVQDDGPHTQWATGLLYDNVQTGKLDVLNDREAGGSSHGWHGAQVMFWNSEVDASACGPTSSSCPSFISATPPAAMNWAVGQIGLRIKAPYDEPDGINESEGTHVAIRSLYLQQLQDRLGTTGVNAVTHPHQRSGDIGAALRRWEGEGDLFPDPTCATGIKHSSGACCPAACVTCGDSCSSNPFGAENCCSSQVNSSGRSCLEYGPPCILPTADPKCEFGIPARTSNGVTVCCDPDCGTCGGDGCTGRPGGREKCCGGRIETANVSCLTNMPPCVVADPQCTTGIASTTSEKACCPATCGRCGGSACSALPGGASDCCKSDIVDNGRSCATNPPPCIMP